MPLNDEEHTLGVRTRCRGHKHVKVYHGALNICPVKSILKSVSYTQAVNSDLSIFRTYDKSAFNAHQTGLRNH